MEEQEKEPSFEELLEKVNTPQRQQFCREMLVDLIQTNAAKRAGFAEKSAHVEGSRLMRIPEIRRAVAQGLRELNEDSMISRQWILERLKQNLAKADAAGEYQAANRALALLAKANGMLDKDLNINMNHSGQAQVVMYFPDNGRGPKPEGKPENEDDKSKT
jgi:phage terminase small subunit